MRVDRAGLFREVEARTEADACNEALIIIELNLHAVRSTSIVAFCVAVGKFKLRLDISVLD